MTLNSEAGICECCHQPYENDLLVDDATWERIQPDNGVPGAGLLCPDCILTRTGWACGIAVDGHGERHSSEVTICGKVHRLDGGVAVSVGDDTIDLVETADALEAFADIDACEGGNPHVIETERRAARMLREAAVRIHALEHGRDVALGQARYAIKSNAVNFERATTAEARVKVLEADRGALAKDLASQIAGHQETARQGTEAMMRANTATAKLDEAEGRARKHWQAFCDLRIEIIGHGPMCRDCADWDGRCQGSGPPCDPDEAVKEQIAKWRATATLAGAKPHPKPPCPRCRDAGCPDCQGAV